jgi:hypothetical protein
MKLDVIGSDDCRVRFIRPVEFTVNRQELPEGSSFSVSCEELGVHAFGETLVTACNDMARQVVDKCGEHPLVKRVLVGVW